MGRRKVWYALVRAVVCPQQHPSVRSSGVICCLRGGSSRSSGAGMHEVRRWHASGHTSDAMCRSGCLILLEYAHVTLCVAPTAVPRASSTPPGSSNGGDVLALSTCTDSPSMHTLKSAASAMPSTMGALRVRRT